MTRRRKAAQAIAGLIVIVGFYAIPGLIHMAVGG